MLDLSEGRMAAAFAVDRHDAVNGVVALTMVGELDIVSGDILTRMTLDAVANDVTEVVVDLARVTWLDATGVDALLLGQDVTLRTGCTYRVAAALSSTSWKPPTGSGNCTSA